MNNIENTSFYKFLRDGIDKGGFKNDDITAIIIPLFKAIADVHSQGNVVDWQDFSCIRVVQEKFSFSPESVSLPQKNDLLSKIITQKDNSVFDISGEFNEKKEVGEYGILRENVEIQHGKEPITSPVFLGNWKSYEIEGGYHDQKSDIFILGMILASIAGGVDFTQEQELENFVNHRGDLLSIFPGVHPAIAKIIYEMTQLDRSYRIRDLAENIVLLENYREYSYDLNDDLSYIGDPQGKQTKESFIQEKLKNRLFESSRRNKLLFFSPNAKFINLTLSSVPQVLNYKNINPKTLFYWNNNLEKKILKSNKIVLGNYLEFSDNPYLTPGLNKIRLESQKDINEFGFSQLKLVIAFLNWNNFKENVDERIHSPLLLLPVNIQKKKGIEDQYILEYSDEQAEVNPVLASTLKQLYGIILPEKVDLKENGIEKFHSQLAHLIEKSSKEISLDFIQKPRLQLIHSQAKKVLNKYKKRYNKRAQLQSFHDIDYSYSRTNTDPLGIKLFNNYVKGYSSSLEYLINNDIGVSQANNVVSAKTDEVLEREFYQIDTGSQNAHRWEFDLCNMVLGNFNYKKMSLVQDYEKISDNNIENQIFNELFTDEPRQKNIELRDYNIANYEKQFHIMPYDSTQNKAVAFAKTSNNYIIQGPPGTGKSQTISNLIVDYVARGKKVLFVCEKRAAIDVVFHRLKQHGLENICSLIHDSQNDKKPFIMELKSVYEKLMIKEVQLDSIIKERTQNITRFQELLLRGQDYHRGMKSDIEGMQYSLNRMYQIYIENNDVNFIEEVDYNLLPGYDFWETYGDTFSKLGKKGGELLNSEYFNENPFKNIKIDFCKNEGVDSKKLLLLSRDLLTLLSQLQEEITVFSINKKYIENIKTINDFLSYVSSVDILSQNDSLDLLEEENEISKKFEQTVGELHIIKTQILKAQEDNLHWKEKMSVVDTQTALEIVTKYESSLFRFLNGRYRSIKKILKDSYDFSSHQISPSFESILKSLSEEYRIEESFKTKRDALSHEWGFEDILQLEEELKNLREKKDNEIIDFLKNQTDRSAITDLLQYKTRFDTFSHKYEEVFTTLHNDTFDIQIDGLENVIKYIGDFSYFLPLLKKLDYENEYLDSLYKNSNISSKQLQALLAKSTIDSYFYTSPKNKRVDGQYLEELFVEIKELHNKIFDNNAKYILLNQENLFKEMIHISEASTAGKGADIKKLKSEILKGRKILENEFGKKMRYKSIRDLVGEKSGRIIREMKPVWLMSPLSVSDTLPLDSNYFDVVIFDEASQITLEEGIPSLYRGKQAVIVGDEMQMPPSNFFGSSTYDEDDLWTDEDDETSNFQLDADSLLTQGARKFGSIMLGWHYRSKHETLIAFSNTSFYNNELLTIPDTLSYQKIFDPIEIKKGESYIHGLEAVHNRPISYHYLEKGLYKKRKNDDEALYIAHLIRDILVSNSKMSIGVVSFSMEQQNNIEEKVYNLAKQDPVFSTLLEEEVIREDDNQFVGLIFKNLENIQGDERDIIIISTCYGYNESNKMLMNFGPINKRGGEKRLNVLFSRAKKRMCVVSSIQHGDITNDYNEGANYFKKYLNFAQSASEGNMKKARSVLKSINAKETIEEENNIITQEISHFLIKNGYTIENGIGESKFQVQIGIKKDGKFILGVMIDDGDFYKNNDIFEQYVFKNEILSSNGWNIFPVFTKDWYDDRKLVEKNILRKLESIKK